MRISVILTLLLTLFSPILTKDACVDFIEQLVSNQKQPKTLEQKHYFEFSGIQGENDLGRKTDCEAATPIRKYYIIGEIKPAAANANTKGYDEFETGICVPEYCTPQILSANKGNLLRLAHLNNWSPKGNLILHDPNAPPSRGMLYYTLTLSFCALVVTCIVSTIAQNIDKIQEKFSKEAPTTKKSNWVYKSFDMVENLKGLYKTAKECGQSDHLSMFGFIRFCSIFWIISFHTQYLNKEMFKSLQGSTFPWIYGFFSTGDVAPGYFFFMGGFLAAFTLTGKATREGRGFSQFLSDMLHRFYKIYPGAVVAIFLYWIVMPGLTNGTLWNRYTGAIQVCEEKWYEKFLLFDNFTQHIFDWCASWTWYIDVDFQVYPVIILLAYYFGVNQKSKQFVYGFTVLLTLISFFMGMQIINYHQKKHTPGNFKFNWYGFTPCRIGEPLVGALLGFQYYEYAKLKQRKYNFIAYCEDSAVRRYISMAVGIGLNSYGIFFSFGSTLWNPAQWDYMRRAFIIVGTALTLMPLANNCESILKNFMNLRIFQIIGKLCFGAYLLHWPIALAMNYTSLNIPDHYDHDLLMAKIYKVTFYSFLAALVYHLVLEKPLLNIEAHFSKGKRANKSAPVAVESAPSTPATIAQGYAVLDEESDKGESTPHLKGENSEVSQDIELGTLEKAAV